MRSNIAARTQLMGMAMSDGAVGLILLLGGIVYFLPSLIAAKRGHHQAVALLALNLLLGWTLLGWVGALVWSLLADRREAAAPELAGDVTAPPPPALPALAVRHNGREIVINRADNTATVDGLRFATPEDARDYIDRQDQPAAG
jgi:hypothetical protein